MSPKFPMLARVLAVLLAFTLVAAACGGDDDDEPAASGDDGATEESGDDGEAESGDDSAAEPASDACGAGADKVGFLYVGPKDDFGYNQAAYEAAVAMGEATGVEVLHAENVPETIEDAVPVMEDMIAQGATILFPTSYGHFQPAVSRRITATVEEGLAAAEADPQERPHRGRRVGEALDLLHRRPGHAGGDLLAGAEALQAALQVHEPVDPPVPLAAVVNHAAHVVTRSA